MKIKRPLFITSIALVILVSLILEFFSYRKQTQSTLAPELLQWTNPLSNERVPLPPGFSVVPTNTKSDLLLGSFSNNPDALLEQIAMETSPQLLEFSSYAQALYRAKADSLGSSFRLSELTLSKVGDVDVAEFGFEREVSGVKYQNTFHVWTYDARHFWNLISTIRLDDKPYREDSAKFLEFMIKNTRIAAGL